MGWTRRCLVAFIAALSTAAIMPSALAADEGEIKLTFLGTGAPRPSHDRYGPAILVEAGDFKIMVDAGPGMRERLFQSGGFEQGFREVNVVPEPRCLLLCWPIAYCLLYGSVARRRHS